jgi:hypothetical protein
VTRLATGALSPRALTLGEGDRLRLGPGKPSHRARASNPGPGAPQPKARRAVRNRCKRSRGRGGPLQCLPVEFQRREASGASDPLQRWAIDLQRWAIDNLRLIGGEYHGHGRAKHRKAARHRDGEVRRPRPSASYTFDERDSESPRDSKCAFPFVQGEARAPRCRRPCSQHERTHSRRQRLTWRTAAGPTLCAAAARHTGCLRALRRTRRGHGG